MKNPIHYGLAALALATLALFALFDWHAALLIAPAMAVTEEGLLQLTEAYTRRQKGLEDQVADLEQKLARGGAASGFFGESRKSLGELFVESAQFKAMDESDQALRASLSVKTAITSDTGSGGPLARPALQPGVIAMAQRNIRIRDVLADGRTDAGSIEYLQQKTRTNTAATVEEGGQKPEATLAYELKTAPVRTIAVTLPASRQILSDAPMLRSTIDNELLYMLADKEEQQILNGDGTGVNILGVIPQATAFAAPFTVAAPTMIDVLLLALAQNEAADYEADYIALNPLDWRRIQALKDGEGRYLANGPFNAEQIARLWQTPIVPTKAIAADKFLVGDGKRGAQVFDRWQARVEVGYVNDDFRRNMVTLLAEERLALAVYKPGSQIYGDFSDAITAATTP